MSLINEVELKFVSDYGTEKIDAELLNSSNYISTDNLIPEKGGAVNSDYLPTKGRVSKYSLGDTLVSNIRPYFKKILFAKESGGCSNDVIVFKPKLDKVDPKYLYYQLSKDEFFDFMMAGANGVKMPRGNKNTIPTFKLYLHEIPTQRRIASILSAYDDLIENNLKRIKLLEEIAQRTYEEWFVKFRVNGEQLPIDEKTGLPVGWEIKCIGDCQIEIGDGNYSSKYPKADEFLDFGIPFFSTREIVNGRLLTQGVKYISKAQHQKLTKGHLKSQDIILSTRGSIGKLAYVDPEFEGFNISAQLVLFRCDNKTIFSSFLFYQLCESKTNSQLIGLGTGTAQPQLPIKTLNYFKIILPDALIQNQFDKLISKNLMQISFLNKKIILLKESRDILLPKLMNGTINVEKE